MYIDIKHMKKCGLETEKYLKIYIILSKKLESTWL